MNKPYLIQYVESFYEYENDFIPSPKPRFFDYELPCDNSVISHYFYKRDEDSLGEYTYHREGLFNVLPEVLVSIFGDITIPVKLKTYRGNVLQNKIYVDEELKTFNCSALDIAFLSKFGNRRISQLITNFIRFRAISSYSYDNGSTANTLRRAYVQAETNPNIKGIVFNKFLGKWTELYDTIIKKYDVLKPFDISLNESESDKLKTIQDTSNRVINETLKTDYQTLKDKSTNTNNEKLYGFNSETGVNSDSADSSTENEFSSLNNDTKTGSTTDTRNYERDITKSRDYSRSGNIGNRSYSELIIKEREKLMFNLQDIILEDIASVLCSYTY